MIPLLATLPAWLLAPETQRALALLAVLGAVVWLTLRALRRGPARGEVAGSSCGGGCGCAKPRPRLHQTAR